MGLILKRPKSSFFKKRFYFISKPFQNFKYWTKVLLLAMDDYNFFQLGLVSQSDNHCKLHQATITK